LDRYIMVLLGGAIGSLTRYVVGMAVMTRLATRFPFGTMIVNVTGSFLIGVLMTLFSERPQPSANWRLVLVVGFLGGYTTFSSFEWETLALVKGGGQLLAFLNVTGSVILGYAAVWLGSTLVGRR
jgi:CrcB protein